VNRAPLIVLAAVLAIGAGWAGEQLLAGRSSRPAPALGVRVAVGETSPPTAADLAAAAASAAPAAIDAPPPLVKIPRRLPRFSLNDLQGKPSPIEAYRGRSLIINFWATWCAPCRREIPLLQTVDAAWRPRNFRVLGIAVDHRDQVASFARRLKIAYPLMSGEEDALGVAAEFGVASPVFPFTVFTDDRGEVVALYLGELHAAEIHLILGIVQRVNGGEIPLQAARQAIDTGLGRLAQGASRPTDKVAAGA